MLEIRVAQGMVACVGNEGEGMRWERGWEWHGDSTPCGS